MKRSQIKRRPLADTVLASLEPEERDYRELDGNGLYFRVKKNGAKSWNLRYKKADGKWSWLGLGGFPAVSGKAARQKAQELQQLASDGIDLSSYRQEQNTSAKQVYTFAQSAETWFERKQQSGLSKGTLRQMRLYLDRDILPALGNKDITAITRGDCAGVQAAIESRNAHVIAGKVRRWVSQIFSEAIARGRCELNPASELRHIAESGPRTQNYPHLLEHELPDFLKELRNGTARMRFLTTAALRMVLMTASRPGMVRHAEWKEIDLSRGLWTIDKQKMKMRRDFVCPLPRQIVETLREVYKLSNRSRYVFPGIGHVNSMMSENTINKAIATIGYKGRMVGHGSRHTASTLLREHGWNRDYVEMQLAHVEPGTAGVYNKAAYVDQRTAMMQWYADYLDALEEGLSEARKRRFDDAVNVVPYPL